MNYGHFDELNKEYVITRPDTPSAWANYLGSPEYGAIISNNAGGYSFVKSGANGRVIRYRFNSVATDQPAVQVYGGNWVSGCPEGKEGATYADYCAVAMECQGCPDAPNKPGFPSQLLTPEKPYRRSIVFSFSTTK